MNKDKTASTSFRSSIPLVACILDILSLVIKSESPDGDGTVLQDKNRDAASESNMMAQKHFRQIQHIRGA